jgi:hypothetical protein
MSKAFTILLVTFICTFLSANDNSKDPGVNVIVTFNHSEGAVVKTMEAAAKIQDPLCVSSNEDFQTRTISEIVNLVGFSCPSNVL